MERVKEKQRREGKKSIKPLCSVVRNESKKRSVLWMSPVGSAVTAVLVIAIVLIMVVIAEIILPIRRLSE